MAIERIDEIVGRFPFEAISPCAGAVVNGDDTVLLCAGFEDRSIEFSKRMMPGRDVASATVVVFRYMPPIKEDQPEGLMAILRERGFNPILVEYDRERPEGFSEKVIEMIPRASGRLYVDLSSMSRLLIVQLICSICESKELIERVVFIYTEAKTYYPVKSEYESRISQNGSDYQSDEMYFLSSGVYDVTAIPELSSIEMMGLQNHLIIFPSFNRDQFNSVRTEIQPSFMSIIHGIPPSDENKWRTDAIAKINRTDSAPKKTDDYKVSTLDYRETLKCLLGIYSKHCVFHKIIVSPTGSKMQSLAVGLFRGVLKDVQIIYPTSRTYTNPGKYTEGINQVYAVSLRGFGSILR
jgi:hypothetical protein